MASELGHGQEQQGDAAREMRCTKVKAALERCRMRMESAHGPNAQSLAPGCGAFRFAHEDSKIHAAMGLCIA